MILALEVTGDFLLPMGEKDRETQQGGTELMLNLDEGVQSKMDCRYPPHPTAAKGLVTPNPSPRILLPHGEKEAAEQSALVASTYLPVNRGHGFISYSSQSEPPLI